MTAQRVETLAEVTKKRIVIPIFDCVVIDKMDQPPTAMQVAAAIVAAARETGANAEHVAQGRSGAGSHFATSRARAYAALALRAICPDNGNVALGRMVGSRSPSSYIAGIDTQLRNGTLHWWDDAVFMRVVEAIEKIPVLDDNPSHPHSVNKARHGDDLAGEVVSK